jgi:hypothetical protein
MLEPSFDLPRSVEEPHFQRQQSVVEERSREGSDGPARIVLVAEIKGRRREDESAFHEAARRHHRIGRLIAAKEGKQAEPAPEEIQAEAGRPLRAERGLDAARA